MDVIHDQVDRDPSTGVQSSITSGHHSSSVTGLPPLDTPAAPPLSSNLPACSVTNTCEASLLPGDETFSASSHVHHRGLSVVGRPRLAGMISYAAYNGLLRLTVPV